MSGVQVLQDGNPRKGGMDEDERDQCIHDIINWFERKADLEARGANNKEIDALEEELGREIPQTLRDLLKKQSGGLWFESYKSLSPEEIVRTAETLSGYGGWKPSFVPFAADVDNNSLVVDVAAKNAVYAFCDDGLGERKDISLSAYLEKYRNQLLSGQYDFVEDVGVVERSSSRK